MCVVRDLHDIRSAGTHHPSSGRAMEIAQPTQQPKRARIWRRREALSFYLCISPWLIGFVLFTAGPMLASLWLSLTDWNLLTPPRFIGLENYERLLTNDPRFLQAVKVTLAYTLAYVPLEMVGALLIALLLNQPLRGMRVFRTIFYLPSVLAGVAYIVLWMWLLNPEVGLVNTLLRALGVDDPPRWLLSEQWALPALVLMSLWGLGRTVIIYLAGLKGIPAELHEAAALDGAGVVARLFYVTVPLLTPTILFNLVLSIIGTFQTYTQAVVATDGGPRDATLFLMLYLYHKAFRDLEMGYASALAWVLFLAILALTLLVFRSSVAWVYYAGERK